MSTGAKKLDAYERLIRVIIYGVITYFTVYLSYRALGWDFSSVTLVNQDENPLLTDQHIDEILVAIPVSFLLSVGWVFIKNRKYAIRFLQFIGATQSFGDEQVWDFVFNTRGNDVAFVNVKDYSLERVFSGWLVAYSESQVERELYLEDVIIYDFQGKKIDRVNHMYLYRNGDSLNLEFP